MQDNTEAGSARTNSDELSKGEIVKIQGAKFKISRIHQNGKLNLRLQKGQPQIDFERNVQFIFKGLGVRIIRWEVPNLVLKFL